MRQAWLGLAAVFLIGWTGCNSAQVPNPKPPQGGGVEEMNKQLGRGVNFGNMLEAPSEGAWGLFMKEEFFDKVKEGGFGHIRLPVSWTHHAAQAAPYAIDPQFFARVDWALDQAEKRGLRVVLNTHHYDALNANPAGEEARALAIWRQVAERYKNRPATLYFEVLNEPHGKFNDDPALWNAYLAKALSLIRQSNPNRAVIAGPVGWNNIGKLGDLKLPQDPNLIATVHFYDPFAFTHQGAEWVSPTPPTGVTWTGAKPEFAPGWANWSWDTGVGFTAQGALSVTYTKGWAGFYLHSDAGASGYAGLALKTSRPVNLKLTCNRAASKDFATQPNAETVVPLADCGSPAVLNDLMLQNNSPDAQAPFEVTGLELRGPGKTLPLTTDEKGAISGALDRAAEWAKANSRPLYVGEFGAYSKGDPDSRARWTTFVRAEAEKRGFSWAYWEFGAGFGVYDPATGQWRTPLLKALVP